MTRDHSETKADLTCEECGEPIKQNQIDNKPIYCEFCGAQHSSVDAQYQEISQLEQEAIRFSYTTEELSQEIRNLAYQKIYELLKANFSIMRRLKHQEGLKQSNILRLAKKLRRALLSLSLPSNSTELLTKTSKKKIENYFEDFQASLKKKKKNQSNYLPYVIKNINFIYGLINGDYEFSTLAKYNQKAVKKLKIKYGFKINAKTKNSFSYSLSILMCRKIYRIITASGHVLDLKHSKNELPKRYTLNTAKEITALVLNKDFKRNFSKVYRRLKKDLEINWVYRESFIEHVCSLIKLTYRLVYNNGYSSRLRGFQKLIAEDLKESAFFEDDTNFSPYLKLNLTLILSRIIHYVLDSSLDLTPLQSDPRKLNHTDNLRLANEILDEILADKIIKSEFLKKFYNLSLEEFQKNYEKLQAKLKSDMLYKENFLSFLQGLINSVYKITHTKTKKSKHSKIELAIIQDLANYNFNWELLKKEKSCFYSEEKDKKFLNKNITPVRSPKTSDISEILSYSTLDLIEGLREEIQIHSEELAQLFPDRVCRYSDRHLSRFWRGNNYQYISKVKNRILNPKNKNYQLNFEFPDSSLKLLEDNLEERLGAKAIGCLYIIGKYKGPNSGISTLEFIDMIKNELGKVSGEVSLTNEELSLILTGSKDYIHRTLDTITNSRSKRWYNPDYKFPLERLEDFEQAIRELLGYKAQKCLDLMSTYKAFNPDLNYWHPKDYSIKNPTFFDELDSPVKAYWYGFLCADGWIYHNRPRIGLEQAIKDRDSVVKFTEALGLDISRIEERSGFFRYKGKIKTFEVARITFSSKEITDVLKGYGFSDLKSGSDGLPNFVKSLISQARQEALQMGVHWSDTHSGKVACGWLLGFYDGDGTYIGGRQARISSTNKKLLDDIKKYFGVQNLVYISKSLDESLVEGYWRSTKTLYSLNLGPDVFISMMNSYKGSMVRKRPSNPTSNYLGDYDK